MGSFHAKTHDTFLCIRGSMKVWQDDQCRILGPGDFASVPPVRLAPLNSFRSYLIRHSLRSDACMRFSRCRRRMSSSVSSHPAAGQSALPFPTRRSPHTDPSCRMFDFIGEPFTESPTFPWNDGRPFPVPLFIEAIKAGEDVVPQREYGYPEAEALSESA